MKQETATPADRVRVLLKMYVLALLLAMFISALHAGILFSLGDFLEWLGACARATLGGDRRISSSSLQPFLVFSWRMSRRPRCGQLFSGSRATGLV